MRRVNRRLLREQQGASSVIVALCMTAILIVVALVVDIGATAARKAQLQDAADAAALAVAQRCYDSPQTTELAGCAATVKATAADEATSIAQATVNDGDATLRATSPIWDADLHTVTVELTSLQTSLFSWSAGAADTAVAASATAEWQQPAVALPLAVADCNMPVPTDPRTLSFIGTGAYDGIERLASTATSVIGDLGSGLDLVGYLERVVGCGPDVLAGGWMGSNLSDCEYHPDLVNTLSSVLNRVLPVDTECTAVIASLIGKRVIVPVYEHSTSQLLGSATSNLIGNATITRFAEIIVTGYEFSTLLPAGTFRSYPTESDPSCARSLTDLLGLSDGGVATLLEGLKNRQGQSVLSLVTFILDLVLNGVLAVAVGVIDALLDTLNPLVSALTQLLNICQGVQGYVVDHDMTAEEAAAALVPYRLVA